MPARAQPQTPLAQADLPQRAGSLARVCTLLIAAAAVVRVVERKRYPNPPSRGAAP
ncbi:uncharacterized protein K452DRAFT_293261 [Aplosporella prunicola CBS 121167]|uniref:Uncharacterized protein n=1 Tax=Aplosporella prunicola CBS 121167 TaxID=1176127 RepID=A0A6A6AWM0_9PEZI|nr:uncharacterized protein K452DRAFT_293261 [Aplosporella prunicola CBS 121167]KAF2135375.1 hypothetical protein K452DRAFT_293261 [Aplosporella prunicola CBS 121167]